jgi:uncharacterized protein (TIGR02996 family)
MSDEADFLRAVLDSPADDAPRLVYADWLDEQGDDFSAAKAAFLRTTAAHAEASRTDDSRQHVLAELLRLLAGTLNPEWLKLVSQVPVENCSLFEYACPKRWDNMEVTHEPGVRFCDTCRKPVYYSPTIEEARRNAWDGRCVAVELGVPRAPGDLDRPTLMLAGVVALPDDWQPPDEAAVERRPRRRRS